jgi:hypothetical protein
MATKKKAAKKVASRKPVLTRRESSKERTPTKIILEIVVKIDDSKDTFTKLYSLGGSVEEQSPNFEYTITASGITVSELNINGTRKSNPGTEGKMFARVLASQIYVSVDASRYNPGGSGSLQLKFLPTNKNVFTEPQEFKFNEYGQGGLFLENVKLPL